MGATSKGIYLGPSVVLLFPSPTVSQGPCSSLILLQGIVLWSLSLYLPVILIIPLIIIPLMLKIRTFQSQPKCNWDLFPGNPLSILNLWRLRLGIQKVGGGYAACRNLLGTVLIFPNNIHTSALLREIVAKLDFWPSGLWPRPTVSVCFLRETSVVLHSLLPATMPDWEPDLEL